MQISCTSTTTTKKKTVRQITTTKKVLRFLAPYENRKKKQYDRYLLPYQNKKKNSTTDIFHLIKKKKLVLQISCTLWFKKQSYRFLVPYQK